MGPALAAKIEACRHCLPSGQEQGVHDGMLLLVVFVASMPEHWGQAKEREWLPDWTLVGSHILRGERSSGPAHAI